MHWVIEALNIVEHISPGLIARAAGLSLDPLGFEGGGEVFHRQPPSQLAPYESRIRRNGNPKNHTSAKVVLDGDVEDALTLSERTET